MEDCIFCKITKSEIPSRKVYEDDNFYAFEDIAPVTPALTEADTEVAGKMLTAIQKTAEKIGLAEDGYRVVFNTGEKAGQTVHHLHAHILGGKEMAWPGV